MTIKSACHGMGDGFFSNKNSHPPFECKREIFGSDHLVEKRSKRFRCRNKRIQMLAQPKHFTPKKIHVPEIIPKNKDIQIVRTYDDPLPTRIKLLAFPKVRKLLASRDAYRGTAIDEDRIDRIEGLASRSMLTMYSRLANVQIPTRPRKTGKKWTNDDWKRHCEWLRRRACPKTYKKPKSIQRKNVPLRKLLVSIYQLSSPRNPRSKYRPPIGYESVVKDTAKFYEPTQRIMKLAEPKKVHFGEDEDSDEDFNPFEVKIDALKYNPSQRIQQLAVPKNPSHKFNKEEAEKEGEEEELPSGVLKRALIAVSTPRTIELAKPRANLGEDDEEEKPNVNPKALKAKATARILELAKPRECPK